LSKKTGFSSVLTTEVPLVWNEISQSVCCSVALKLIKDN